jgi:hypothetical protein
VHTEPGAKEETASGFVEIPDDIGNGMTSILLKNLEVGAFGVYTSTATPRRDDDAERVRQVLGRKRLCQRDTLSRHPESRQRQRRRGVGNRKAAGRLLMWITRGESPTLVRFEGPIFIGGPIWRCRTRSAAVETLVVRSGPLARNPRS